ncbi:extensin-2 [Scaptodrosophila lebanonensis]|uniref:Extensin-2 n=1 Tax=Drosophila lebanonensis TaxID=7225 RepID=A0A6J2TR76_DROLE|nr:extensin-2 [Scaptodrosophila lebanonensis]
MIQRLVAGHIQNAQGHSTYEVSAVSANSSSSLSYSRSGNATTTTTTTTTTPRSSNAVTPLYFRRKSPTQAQTLSSSYRLAKQPSTTSTTTTKATISGHDNIDDDIDDARDDDEALLSDPDDFDNWDNGILRLSAGSGKETNSLSKKQSSKEDSKKTLADQVRDGKYGLIEKELFRRVPKRPGVLSYARNSEVPLDTERNYGGLQEEDIWLAEDHLLVIKGGSLNENENTNDANYANEPWPAIDDYDAPERQIKIPANPPVPPPFPVQLDAHGPLQLIRDNKLTIVYPVANETIPVYITSTEANYNSAERSPINAPHSPTRTGALAAAKADDEPSYVYPAPYSPWLYGGGNTNDSLTNPFLKSSRPITLPGLGPWLFNGLNGSLDSTNATNDFDEDDPTLYYPPAYSFVYKSNYSNPVPPGPLVPGIVLPPPPNHFSRLEPTNSLPARRPSTSSTTTTSSTTSTTTTTTTTSTTPPPHRGTVPNISKYTPKYNAVDYSKPPQRQPPKYVERIPVPVAVPIPIYPLNYQPTVRPRGKAPTSPPAPSPTPQTLVFVPSTTERAHSDTLSKSNPIYYEYFEAKRQPAIKSNVIEDFLASTGKAPKLKNLGRHNDVVNITPKPKALPPLRPDYDALGQLLRTNLISQPYAIYTVPTGGSGVDGSSTHPPLNRFQQPDFDKKPFLPMVNYSADEQDKNAFKAIVYASPAPPQNPTPDAYQQQQQQRQRQMRVGKHQLLEPYIYSTPVPLPDSYLPEQRDYGGELLAPKLLLQRQRQLRVGKQQQQPPPPAPPLEPPLEQQFEPQGYSTPQPPGADSYLPTSAYVDDQRSNQIEQQRLARPPVKYQLLRSHFVRNGQLVAPYGDYSNITNGAKPPPPPPLQYWQRPLPAAPYKRLRQSNKHQFPPYFVPNYAPVSGPSGDSLYRLMPVPQHKHWRQGPGQGQIQNHKQQQQHLQPQQIDSYYPERGVPIGHSLAGDILVNYNTNNQFNPQAELVPHAQLGPPPVPPPLSYQAQSAGPNGGPLWSDRPVRQSRAHEQA